MSFQRPFVALLPFSLQMLIGVALGVGGPLCLSSLRFLLVIFACIYLLIIEVNAREHIVIILNK